MANMNKIVLEVGKKFWKELAKEAAKAFVNTAATQAGEVLVSELQRRLNASEGQDDEESQVGDNSGKTEDVQAQGEE